MSQQQPPESEHEADHPPESRSSTRHASQAYDDAASAGSAEIAAEAAAAGSGAELHDGDSGESEATRLKDALLRLRADMDNREKRMEREMSKARRFALDSLLRDLIPVLDTLDQALGTAVADVEAANEGMELTRRQLLKVLTGHGLEAIDPVGERFDPTWHEAMTMRPAEGQDVDTVAEVLQKGYRLNERLIRPARVVVAK